MTLWQTLKLFAKYLRPYRKKVALGLLTLAIVDSIGCVPPLILKHFIDLLQKGDTTKGWTPFLLLGLGYAAIAAVQAACRYLWRVFLIYSSHRAAEKIRQEYFEKLQKLPQSFYQKNPIGDLMALATNDVEAVRFALGPGLLVCADAIFMFLVFPPMMFWLSPKLTFAALLPLAALPFIIFKTDKLIHERFGRVQSQFSNLSGFAQENIEGIKVVKAFNREWSQLRRFSMLGREFVRLNLKLARTQSIFEPAFLLCISAGMAGLLFFGGGDVLSGAIGLGTFIAMTRFLESMGWPMMAFGMVVTHYQRGRTSLERIYSVLNLEEEKSPAADRAIAAKLGAATSNAPLLEARNLSFAYPGQRKPALNGVSFKVNEGDKVAIVGPIGSGKSTLVRLLSGMYPIKPGMLFWKGVDVTELPLEKRRDFIAVVPQDPFLFAETLGWNVALGFNCDRGTSDLQNVLKKAGLESELREWGLDKSIGERGSNLSGGQRARVTLARALGRKSELLILDDALSSVDTETEANILSNLDAEATELNFHSKAILMITHRFTGLTSFDQILAFRNGKLEQCGSPDELAQTPGLYRELWTMQNNANSRGAS